MFKLAFKSTYFSYCFKTDRKLTPLFAGIIFSIIYIHRVRQNKIPQREKRDIHIMQEYFYT